MSGVLTESAGIMEYEKVQIVNINNGERFETYVINGARNSGMVCLNGPAARKAQVGDLVIIIAYAFMSLDEVKVHESTIIFPDESNKLTLEV